MRCPANQVLTIRSLLQLYKASQDVIAAYKDGEAVNEVVITPAAGLARPAGVNHDLARRRLQLARGIRDMVNEPSQHTTTVFGWCVRTPPVMQLHAAPSGQAGLVQEDLRGFTVAVIDRCRCSGRV